MPKSTLRKQRRIAYVVMAVAASVLTPPDPFSLLIMLFPLILLYEISVIVGSLVYRRREEQEEKEEQEQGKDIVPK